MKIDISKISIAVCFLVVSLCFADPDTRLQRTSKKAPEDHNVTTVPMNAPAAVVVSAPTRRAGPAPFPDLYDGMSPEQAELRLLLNDPERMKIIEDNLKRIPNGAHENRLQYGETISNFNMREWAIQKKTEHPGMTYTQLALAISILKQGGLAPLGTLNPSMCEKASQHAQKMSQDQIQYHSHNYGDVAGKGPWATSEIVSESYSGVGPSLLKAADSCTGETGWVTSESHARRIFPRQKSFCCDMALGRNKTWYCACIVHGPNVDKY